MMCALRIGDVAIPAYVLDDGRRVLSQGGMLAGLKLSLGSASGVTGNRLANFVSGKALSPYISEELRQLILNPIRFVTPGELLAYGYPATVLADLCDAVLKAREIGRLADILGAALPLLYGTERPDGQRPPEWDGAQ